MQYLENTRGIFETIYKTFSFHLYTFDGHKNVLAQKKTENETIRTKK